jgi:hypothetical protein
VRLWHRRRERTTQAELRLIGIGRVGRGATLAARAGGAMIGAMSDFR